MKIQSNEAVEALMKIAEALSVAADKDPYGFNMEDYRAVVASVLEGVEDDAVRAEVLHHVDF